MERVQNSDFIDNKCLDADRLPVLLNFGKLNYILVTSSVATKKFVLLSTALILVVVLFYFLADWVLLLLQIREQYHHLADKV